MSDAEIQPTLKLIYVALWFVIPALLVTRLRRFRIATATLAFWAAGTLYYEILWRPPTPFNFGGDFLIVGLPFGLLYAAIVSRIHAKLRPTCGNER